MNLHILSWTVFLDEIFNPIHISFQITEKLHWNVKIENFRKGSILQPNIHQSEVPMTVLESSWCENVKTDLNFYDWPRNDRLIDVRK